MYEDLNYTHPEPRDYASQNNAAAIIEYKAAKGCCHKIRQIIASFSADPAAGATLKIEATDALGNYQIVRQHAITRGGPAPLHVGIETKKGQGLKITLGASGTGGVIGYLNISGYEVSTATQGP